MERLKAFGEEFRKKAYARLYKEMAEMIVRIVDRAKCTSTKFEPEDHFYPNWPLFTSVYYQFRWTIYEAYASMRSSPADYTQCEVSVFPLRLTNDASPDSRGASFLMILYDQSNDCQDDFERIVKPKDFAYWNNTDPPDNVTAEEWRYRDKVWDKAMGKRWIPSIMSFTYECMPKTMFPFTCRDEVFRRMPGLKSRIKMAAEGVVFRAKVAKLIKSGEPGPTMHEAFSWMRTKEAKEKMRKERERISPLLTKLTREDLEVATNSVIRFPKGWKPARPQR
jgi:hypothetical protein